MNRPRSMARPAIAAALVIGLAACGGMSSPSTGGDSDPVAGEGGVTPSVPTSSTVAAPAPAPPGEAINACALLTDADIREATGFTVLANDPVGGITSTGCRWELDYGDPDIHEYVTLNVQSPGGRAWYDGFPFDAPASVEGLGDKAVEDGGVVFAVQGDSAVIVSHLYAALDADMQRAIVEIALSRL